MCVGHDMFIIYQLFVANLTAMSGYLFKWWNRTSQWTSSDLYSCFTSFFCIPLL